jgi:hypothetical protein
MPQASVGTKYCQYVLAYDWLQLHHDCRLASVDVPTPHTAHHILSNFHPSTHDGSFKELIEHHDVPWMELPRIARGCRPTHM